jgi:hyperosmotically inducible protein
MYCVRDSPCGRVAALPEWKGYKPMKLSPRLLAGLVASVLTCSLGSATALAQAPDNTKQNKAQSPTADNQPNAKSDRLTTANVRKAIIADKNLSTYAHNVKIITSNGQVTLKGPVKSEDEKQQVFKDATSVISSDKVTNQLAVKQ